MPKKKEQKKTKGGANTGPSEEATRSQIQKIFQSKKKSSQKNNKSKNNNNKQTIDDVTVTEFRPSLSTIKKKDKLQRQLKHKKALERKELYAKYEEQKQEAKLKEKDKPKIPTEEELKELQDQELDKRFFEEINRSTKKSDELRLIGDVKKYAREGVNQSKESLRKELNTGRDPRYVLAGASQAQEAIRGAKKAALDNARAEILFDQHPGGFIETEEGENVWELSQKEIKKEVAVQSARKAFELSLTQFGPYTFDYSRNGRWIVLGGRKGHVAMIDSVTKTLKHEFNVKEVVRHVKFLHNETMYAVAQKNFVFIYNENGGELHRLKAHDTPLKLEFLPYHFLLVSVSKYGKLFYQDTSTGANVFNTKFEADLGGATGALRQNPYNAVISAGHTTGVVSFWAPSSKTPLVKMLCHRGPVRSIAFDRGGHYMVTSGQDHKLRIWDIRTFQVLHQFYCPPSDHIDVSQLKVLAVGLNSHVRTYQNIFDTKKNGSMPNPYICHKFPGKTPAVVTDVHFCPYDDVLGIGTSQGFTSILVPGSGDPNYDSYEVDPHQTVSQRQEHEVKMLLEKIQPGMISLDPNFIGNINPVKKKKWSMKLQEQAQKDMVDKETEDLAESFAKRMEKNRQLFEQGALPNIQAEADKLELKMMEKELGETNDDHDHEEEHVEGEMDEGTSNQSEKKKRKGPPGKKGAVTRPYRSKGIRKPGRQNDNNRSSREPQFEAPSALNRFKRRPRNG